jgi:DNA primase catalytic subunit
VPAVKGENYPETISEFLIADEECKSLTPEERLKSTIYIQITRVSEEELQDRLDHPLRAHQTNGFEPGQTGQSYEMKDENGNVTKKVTPEDVAEMRRKMEESETQAENKLNDFFSEKPKNLQ